MTDIEQRLRDSLTARSTDVEPTPALWQEVDRRVTRRRRLRVAGWSLVGATAIVVGVLVLPGLVGTGLTVPDIEPVETPPAPTDEGGEDATDEDTPDEAAPDDAEDPAPTGPDDTDVLPTGDDTLLTADGGELRLIGPTGDTSLITLDGEGESSVAGIAVRPGSTPDDLTAAVLTRAEGMWDLRELRVVDGEVSLEVFDEGYRPGLGGGPAGEGLTVRGPVWSPDGTSLAWLESGTGGVILQTIGWSDGPGTGDPATDNAQWDVGDVVPMGAVPNDWVEAGGNSTAIRVTAPDGDDGWYLIRLDRQADDAWALAGSEVVTVDGAGPGTVVALAGVPTGSDGLTAQWLVRTTADGVEVVDGSVDPATPVELSGGLLPEEGSAGLWARPLTDGVLVGSASTRSAWVVTAPDQQTPLEGDVTHADVVR